MKPILESGDYYWEGSKEICNKCKESYPMVWIIFDGKEFLCYSCFYEKNDAARTI